MKIVFLGIGTNLGNRENKLSEAVEMIREDIGPILGTSSVYETEPWGFQSADQFLNMVIRVGTNLPPSEVLNSILAIESSAGRKRSANQYVSRIIDIDILFYEDLVIEEENLKIPHPLIHERRFVLVPLCDIAPEMIHPVFGKTFAELLEVCSDTSSVRKVKS